VQARVIARARTHTQTRTHRREVGSRRRCQRAGDAPATRGCQPL